MSGTVGAPKWVTDGTKLLVTVDGPFAGMWWTAEDWAERVRAAESLAHTTLSPSYSLGYRRAGRRVDHPKWPTQGDALTYQPRVPSEGRTEPLVGEDW
jgi:hypothetical protein